MKLTLPISYLKANLNYDPLTGHIWYIKSGANRRLDVPAGCINVNGYINISLKSTLYKAHRIIWAWMTGIWPEHEIDHINLIRSDNRWANLRLATVTQNRQNKPLYKNSGCGLKGVTWHKAERKWRAQIQINKRKIIIGRFSTPEEAHAAYAKTATEHFGEFARDR